MGHWENSEKRKFPVGLFSSKPKSALWSRHIALQKAKVAREKNWGMASPYARSSMAEHCSMGRAPFLFSQDRVSFQTGRVPSHISCKPRGSFCPPFSGHQANRGQWLPGHYNGSNKNGDLGKTPPGMQSFQSNCKAESRAASPELMATVPFHVRLRQRAQWWSQNTRNPEVMELIIKGVSNSTPLPPHLTGKPCIRSSEETKLALETSEYYISVGAVKATHHSQARH